MKKTLIIILALTCTMQLWSIFGKNKIQNKPVEWAVIKTLHYDIYYEKENEEFGRIAALMSEEAYYYLKSAFIRPVKKRIPIIFYSTNQNFETTNIIPNLLSEGVGGFTESDRNRVAIPFNGSYLDMEETLIHELTHAYINDINNGNNSLLKINRLPFWFSEGLPEYFSIGGKSTKNNSFVLDLIYNSQIPEFEYLGGFYAYRIGELFISYLSEKYGQEKVLEFYYELRYAKNQELAVKKVFDQDFKKLQKEWRNYLKRKYSIYMQEYDVPYEVFEQLTFRDKDGSGMNSPVKFVPKTGEYLYFSDKSIHRDIWKNSILDPQKAKRIIKGETSAAIEEFHYERNNLDFFPDGDRFAFAAETSRGDVIHIASLKKRKIIQTINIPDIDVIYELDVNPSGNKIAFGGQKNFTSDIFIYDLETEKITQITDDKYYDGQPIWNNSEDKLAFVSERKLYGERVKNHLFYQLSRDIYYYDFEEKAFYQVTQEKQNNTHPIWTNDDEKIIFLHEGDIANNLEIIKLETGERASITNTLGYINSIDLNESNDELLLSIFYDRGWDIYLASNPLKNLEYRKGELPKLVQFEKNFYETFKIDEYKYFGKREREFRKELPEIRKNITRFNLGNIIEQDSLDKAYNLELDSKPIDIKIPEISDYKSRYYLDNLWGGLAYSPSGGTFAEIYFKLSNLMGDSKIGITLGVNGNIENSNFRFNYMNLARRIDYGMGGFYLNDATVYKFINESGGTYGYLRERIRNIGIMGSLQYPFSKYCRLDFDAILNRKEINYDWAYSGDSEWTEDFIDNNVQEQYGLEAYNENIISPQITFNFDNAIYGSTGPISGWKSAILFNHSYSNIKNHSLFYTDVRRYFFFNKRYSIAARFIGGTIIGETSSRFDLDYHSGVRGFYDDELRGRNKLVSNLELRFPFIDRLSIAFPLPIDLGYIRGSTFLDAGTVWNKDGLMLGKQNKLEDLKIGMGFGPRVNVGYFVIKFDVAWNTDLENFSRPSYYFSLSPDF